ncbi:MAG: hypothetical protein P3W94_005515 [Paracoccus sp. (in: a-proteobacteria)]|nr:hypothetical protein [Paracoccus sp. (in: a-proteobacteria)]
MAKVGGKSGAKMSGSGSAGLANINLKVSEDERWAFKEWCVNHRISQVDGFRRAFELLKRHGLEDRTRSAACHGQDEGAPDDPEDDRPT